MSSTQEEKIQFAVEALRRASAKFAGRQKVHVSNKFGFTKYTKKDSKKGLRCSFGVPFGAPFGASSGIDLPLMAIEVLTVVPLVVHNRLHLDIVITYDHLIDLRAPGVP